MEAVSIDAVPNYLGLPVDLNDPKNYKEWENTAPPPGMSRGLWLFILDKHKICLACLSGSTEQERVHADFVDSILKH